MSGKVKLGVNMFSFNTEFYSGKFSWQECIVKAAEAGGTGIELIGAQMVPGFPTPTDAFIREFKDLCAANNIQPVSYGAYVDSGVRYGRGLNEAELTAMTLNDIQIAAKMGCTVLRTQQLLGPKLFEKMASMAEDYGVHIGVELHAPHNFDTPIIMEYIEACAKTGSPYLGIIPDFGIFMEHPDHAFYNGYQSMGAEKKYLDYAIAAFENGEEEDKVQAEILKMGAAGMSANIVPTIWSKYHKADLEGLKNCMPYIKYAHGKFYYVTEDYKDPSIPYDKILKIFDEADYDGYIASEYEGHFFGSPEMTGQDTVEQVRRHIKMGHNILGY